MHSYAFQSVWRLPAAPERCWRELLELRSWQEWWPAIKPSIKGEPWLAGPLKEGTDFWLTVRSPLLYRLRIQLVICTVVPEHSLTVRGSGDLLGTGDADFDLEQTPSGEQTVLRMNWAVQTTKPWMNFLAPLTAPIFRWAHRLIMRDGERRFSRWLTEHPEDPERS